MGKKNGKKRIVQNYYYLNSWIVKKNYLLLLILDIIKDIGIKKVFTNLEVYNIRVKKENE